MIREPTAWVCTVRGHVFHEYGILRSTLKERMSTALLAVVQYQAHHKPSIPIWIRWAWQ